MPDLSDLASRLSEISNLIHQRTRGQPNYVMVPIERLRRMHGGAHGEEAVALQVAAAVDDLPEFGFGNVSLRLVLD